MQKRIIQPGQAAGPVDADGWLDLEPIAQVEITSEDPEHPIEAALGAAPESGWRASTPGPQIIRLIFTQPQQIRRIRLIFEEMSAPRTQEFALRWSPDNGRSYQDVVRQQYTFSPSGATREVEDYRVELSGVTLLALLITPDIGGGAARASLLSLRLA
ncbi:carbohydrate-binding protein [Chloroflexales bacterium ZM16-3]|nr:carbohydrate-binding protein [Chloroflexales bacterium ZM16-3]